MRKYWLTAAIPLAAITVAAAIGPIAASGATTTLSAKTTMTNRDDSALTPPKPKGNWAEDNFTRGAQISFKGAAVAPVLRQRLPCYAYTGKVSDVGHFVTDVGQPSPGFGYLNGGNDPRWRLPLTARWRQPDLRLLHHLPVSGASAANVPPAESGNGLGSGEWPELFFPAGTQFWDSSGRAARSVSRRCGQLGPFFSYTYAAKPGADHNCPNMTSQWKDASPEVATFTGRREHPRPRRPRLLARIAGWGAASLGQPPIVVHPPEGW